MFLLNAIADIFLVNFLSLLLNADSRSDNVSCWSCWDDVGSSQAKLGSLTNTALTLIRPHPNENPFMLKHNISEEHRILLLWGTFDFLLKGTSYLLFFFGKSLHR